MALGSIALSAPIAAGLVLAVTPAPVAAQQVVAFQQALAEAAARAGDRDIAEFYRGNGYQPIWTGSDGDDKARRAAFIAAAAGAGAHGLPAGRYDPEQIKARLAAARTAAELGALEVELSRLFLRYARDIQTGILNPQAVDEGIKREVPLRARLGYLTSLSQSSPRAFFAALPPSSPEYTRLMKAKFRLERELGAGGWGAPVPGRKLQPGDSGAEVVALRNRLIAMGYLGRSASVAYDGEIQAAVQQFQLAHGLEPDGVAGAGTLTELNMPMEERLAQVIVAMERERWLNRPLGLRHILVNLTDFKARIIDNGKVTFETRSVVGMNADDRRSPEFSDVMEFMVINPSWYVPRSIATKEYLPMLKKNPNAVRHLEITDRRGRKVNRGAVDFTQFTEQTFPFAMREPPNQGNALGLVKFMFPNRHNIYLHDTPAKNLFGRESRAFSHGCIRLADPFDFAYTLLAKQTSDPVGFFKARLATGVETRVNLAEPVPVHIIYRTAVTTAKGELQFRRDVYGRDARIWRALAAAGVEMRAVQG